MSLATRLGDFKKTSTVHPPRCWLARGVLRGVPESWAEAEDVFAVIHMAQANTSYVSQEQPQDQTAVHPLTCLTYTLPHPIHPLPGMNVSPLLQSRRLLQWSHFM